MYPLRYLPTGHIFISPEDDCHGIVDAMLETDYNEEFCLARDFDVDFIARLMEAGFLVMSAMLNFDGLEIEIDPIYILLPKLHLTRSVLFFPELHIKRNIHPLLSQYELRVNTNFGQILDKCVETHGSDWLTPPLVDVIKNLHQKSTLNNDESIKPVSFEVYRDGELKAGEAGIVLGRVYTSYSGYREENNAGNVQMILMIQWLEKNGFDFFDFGMPLDYKTTLGAQDISPRRFVELFRAATDGTL